MNAKSSPLRKRIGTLLICITLSVVVMANATDEQMFELPEMKTPTLKINVDLAAEKLKESLIHYINKRVHDALQPQTQRDLIL